MFGPLEALGVGRLSDIATWRYHSSNAITVTFESTSIVGSGLRGKGRYRRAIEWMCRGYPIRFPRFHTISEFVRCLKWGLCVSVRALTYVNRALLSMEITSERLLS